MNEYNEHTAFNNNKALEKKNINNDNSKLCRPKSNKSNIATIVISFTVLIFIIYLTNIYLFYKTNNIPIQNKNNFLINGKILNKTEAILSNLKPNPLYKGPIFPNNGIITKEWVLDLINFMEDLDNKKKYIDKYIDKIYLLQMLSKAKNIFMEFNESIVDINIPNDKIFTVVGDIHGQFYDLLNIFRINGYPSEDNPYLFNGDFVDRGVFGIETILTLIAFKILYPKHFFMSRGNHEEPSINKRYGFQNEVFDKYDSDVYECFAEFFKFLPLGHILNNQILVVHGGLFSKEGVTIDELKSIDRFSNIPHKGLMCELLWSDPMNQKGWRPSIRGAGIDFGEDISKKFLSQNNLKLLIRSHQVKMKGYEIHHDGKVITLFSAPNYCDIRGNQGAIIKLKGEEMEPNFILFDASPHPNIPIQKYLTPYM